VLAGAAGSAAGFVGAILGDATALAPLVNLHAWQLVTRFMAHGSPEGLKIAAVLPMASFCPKASSPASIMAVQVHATG
jgi:hypothetical protein